jgi:hypothetical protein
LKLAQIFTEYDQQKINFATKTIQKEKLLHLIKIKHKYKRGLGQETLIRKYEYE